MCSCRPPGFPFPTPVVLCFAEGADTGGGAGDAEVPRVNMGGSWGRLNSGKFGEMYPF